MRYYPIGLDISGRRCLVIGGGEVGERKAQRLLECGARVSVVGRELTPALAGLAQGGRIDHIPGDYDKGLLKGAFLVIGATDDRVVNERIFLDARKRGVLANIVDDPERCDFIVPAVARRGPILVTISSQGASPALARRLRERVEAEIGPEYGELANLLGRLRPEVMAVGNEDTRQRIWEAILDSQVLALLCDGRKEEAEREARRCISSAQG